MFTKIVVPLKRMISKGDFWFDNGRDLNIKEKFGLKRIGH
jgi:hypothetical protein